MKIKWFVSAAPTGRYRSFQNRSWPRAEYADGRIAAAIYCKYEGGYACNYTTHYAKNGGHPPLELCIADYSKTPWQWRRAVKRFATLQEAKDALLELLKANPQLSPKEEKTSEPVTQQ